VVLVGGFLCFLSGYGGVDGGVGDVGCYWWRVRSLLVQFVLWLCSFLFLFWLEIRWD